MRTALIIMLLIGYSACINGSLLEIIRQINSDSQCSWQARRNYLTEVDRENITILMGVKLRYFRVLPVKIYEPLIGDSSPPRFFDASDKWPYCSKRIHKIRNQGRCGSCWAFATSEIISDRMCIKSRGAQDFPISVQNLMTCCRSCGDGCNGGYPEEALRYWVNTGIVTGGDYSSNEGCQTYTSCAFFDNRTPGCSRQCRSGSNIDYQCDLKFGSNAYSVPGNVAAIQKEIQENGPVVACFKVYDDFMAYSRGVYMHMTGGLLGDHAIKIIGWGEENNIPYWLCANSWGEEWGMKGFFKILRGSNESGIEDFVIAGIV